MAEIAAQSERINEAIDAVGPGVVIKVEPG